MSTLADNVYSQLKASGDTLKGGLWEPSDLHTLKMIAADLTGLGVKVLAATSPDDKRRYGEAAERLVDHAALLALSRLNVATNDLRSALKESFLKLVGQWQPKLLPALDNVIPSLTPKSPPPPSIP
jgi:hypothetical protein